MYEMAKVVNHKLEQQQPRAEVRPAQGFLFHNQNSYTRSFKNVSLGNIEIGEKSIVSRI